MFAKMLFTTRAHAKPLTAFITSSANARSF
jgi:hypothetical protein